MSTAEADLYTDEANADGAAQGRRQRRSRLLDKAHLSRSGGDDYVALLAYIERDQHHIDACRRCG